MCCPKFACAISVISCVWLPNVQNYWERKSIIPPTLHLKYRKMNVWLGRKLTAVNVCRKEWSAERACGKVWNVIFKKLSDQICVCVCAESKCQMIQTVLPSQFISYLNLVALLFAFCLKALTSVPFSIKTWHHKCLKLLNSLSTCYTNLTIFFIFSNCFECMRLLFYLTTTSCLSLVSHLWCMLPVQLTAHTGSGCGGKWQTMVVRLYINYQLDALTIIYS